MTVVSDYEILAYLSKDECLGLHGDEYCERISGTELNERRRAASSILQTLSSTSSVV